MKISAKNKKWGKIAYGGIRTFSLDQPVYLGRLVLLSN